MKITLNFVRNSLLSFLRRCNKHLTKLQRIKNRPISRIFEVIGNKCLDRSYFTNLMKSSADKYKYLLEKVNLKMVFLGLF